MNWVLISFVVIFISSALYFYFKHYLDGDIDLIELIIYPSIIMLIILLVVLMVRCNDSEHALVQTNDCHYTGNSETTYIPQTYLVGKVMVTNLMPVTSYQWKCNDGKMHTFDFDGND